MKCTSCGNEIPSDSLFCPVCGRKIEVLKPEEANQAKHKPAVGLIILAAVLGICVIGLAYGTVYYSNQSDVRLQKYNDLATEYNKNIHTINSLYETINNNKSRISNVETENTKLKQSGQMLSELERLCTTYTIGAGSQYFNTNMPIVFLKKGESKTANVMLNYKSGATIYFETYGNSCHGEWTESSFEVNAGLKITAYYTTGITRFRITNNKDDKEFSILAIVTE